MSMVLERIKTYGKLVMFPHTLFSIPFGIISMLIAAKGFPPFWVTFWIVIALVSARTAANALNRLIDKDIDARNKRTALRHMPAGTVSVKEAISLIICLHIAFDNLGVYAAACMRNAAAHTAFSYNRILVYKEVYMGLPSCIGRGKRVRPNRGVDSGYRRYKRYIPDTRSGCFAVGVGI